MYVLQFIYYLILTLDTHPEQLEELLLTQTPNKSEYTVRSI